MTFSVLDAAGNEKVRSDGTFTVLAAQTNTGTVNNWAPGLSGNTYIPWAGASDATFTGLAGGVVGQIVIFKNTGTKVAYFPHQSGSSSTGNKYQNLVTSGPTPVAPGGWIAHQHDGTQWQLIGHEQGAWITPTFNAGDFTTVGGGSWTVQAADVQANRSRLDGRTLTQSISLTTTTVAGSPGALLVKLGGGFTADAGGVSFPSFQTQDQVNYVTTGNCSIPSAGTSVSFYSGPTFAAWTNTTNLTDVYATISASVQ